MLSPYLVLKSAVGAVQDRPFIGKNSNKKLSSIDAAYYNKMVAETGQSTHNPITYFKNLKNIKVASEIFYKTKWRKR